VSQIPKPIVVFATGRCGNRNRRRDDLTAARQVAR
jgi:hypothetical protein